MNHTAPLPAHARHPHDAVPPPVAPHPMLGQPAFERLHRARRRFAWTLTAAMLTIYFGFILTLAFRPAWLAIPLVPGHPTTIGIPIGFGMFVVTFALVALYVHRTNTVYDLQIAAIRAGAQS